MIRSTYRAFIAEGGRVMYRYAPLAPKAGTADALIRALDTADIAAYRAQEFADLSRK